MDAKTKLGAKMAQIRALLDLAEHPGTPEHEAANARSKADAMMQKYRVEEEELIAEDPASVEPVLVEVDLCEIGSPYRMHYADLMWYCTFHNGVRIATRVENRNGRVVRVGMLVGYESDCRYAEYLFTAARLVFSERLEPKVEAHLSEAENIYRLRSAGIERVRISEMLWGNRDKGNLAKIGRVYKAECDRRGEEPALSGRGVTGAQYRESYAEQFVSAFYGRLRAARDAADSVSGGLVLHGRQERVDEAFYARFPNLRPSTLPVQKKECEDCKRTKHPSGKCRPHRPSAVTDKQLDAMMRRESSTAARNGRAAGQRAAREVEIRRGHEQARRVEPGSGGAVTGAIGS